ncbi:hypothetical protein CK498_10160 [Halomonas salipaludis]|uniref:Uncharacterized protein n=2 Tax=Halomonas salipaludis TaxID=2032625 RepID=A0A2A2EYM0_9GAMM|nr:hypothetical protein CK498_10160 [Halomonas salipaludis]
MRDSNEAGLGDETTVDESETLDLEETPEPKEISQPEEVPEPIADEPPLDDASEESASAEPCSLQRMGEVGELEFIQSCVGSDDGDMLNVVNQALANDHCGIARRLYAHQALNGDAAAALAYAQEFDPAQHTPSTCFPEADVETAIFWYETALGIDADNAEASQRLEEMQ